MACLNPMCSIPLISLLTSKDKLLHCLHRLRICQWSTNLIQSLISSSLFGHSIQKGGENFEGETAQFKVEQNTYWFIFGGLAIYVFFKLY